MQVKSLSTRRRAWANNSNSIKVQKGQLHGLEITNKLRIHSFKNNKSKYFGFPKTPLVRPPPSTSGTTMSPLVLAMLRTTQRVPIHRPHPQPFGNWLRTSTTTLGTPTTQRTTLRSQLEKINKFILIEYLKINLGLGQPKLLIKF